MIYGKSITLDENGSDPGAAAVASNAVYHSAGTDFLDKLREGDPRAFDNLILRYSSEVYGLLVRLTGDRDEAADLTQETFLSALRSVQRFRGDSDLKTWLFRIAVNHSRNRFRWWRRRRKESTVSLESNIGETEVTIGETLADEGEGPEAGLIRQEEERRLAALLASMKREHREAIVLRDIQGLSYDEISEALGLNVGTVKSRIARARGELKKRLGNS